jgi:hypothetical protein
VVPHMQSSRCLHRHTMTPLDTLLLLLLLLL